MQKVCCVMILAAMLVGCTQGSAEPKVVPSRIGLEPMASLKCIQEIKSRRFLQIDKLSTAYGTSDRQARGYRYGYGIFDANLNGQADGGERKVYFELSEYSNYVFFEQP